jgi:hypothetical protein
LSLAFGVAGMADRFVVGIDVNEEELAFFVHVPHQIDSGWADPEAFQRLVAEVTWDRLDRETVLSEIAAHVGPGERVVLGSMTLEPDGAVVDTELAVPEFELDEE